jgi:S-adenosylmethionine hydrolase
MSNIYLLSDFGLDDTYVAQMKSVIAGIVHRSTRIIDLTHGIEPGNILEGAFNLWAMGRIIPQGSVTVAVVDPGVGTDRRAVICEARGRLFVGPDNGLFSLLEPDRAWLLPRVGSSSSSTFHGRDLFAPAGARLAVDPGWSASLMELEPGTLTGTLLKEPVTTSRGIDASVAHIDRFGNVLLWIHPISYSDLSPLALVISGGKEFELKHAVTYGSEEGLLFLENSQGCFEIALAGASAARMLGLSAGDRITLIQ